MEQNQESPTISFLTRELRRLVILRGFPPKRVESLRVASDSQGYTITIGDGSAGHRLPARAFEELSRMADVLAGDLNEIAAGRAPTDPEPPPVDRNAVTTIHGTPLDKLPEVQAAPTGQHADYMVLTAEERAKGFVRSVRRAYLHVGIAGPRFPLRDLTDDERRETAQEVYAKFEVYPESESPVSGKYWTQAQLDAVGKGCQTITTMGTALAETYARDPRFYGATMCCHCNRHLPVGAAGEFVWDGTNERVGT